MVVTGPQDLSDVVSDIEDARAALRELLRRRAELVEDARASGMSYRQIGSQLGVSLGAVQKILNRYSTVE